MKTQKTSRLKAFQMDERTIRVNVQGPNRKPNQDKILYLRKNGTVAIYEARDGK